jgi:hypothetical protein
MRQHLRICVLAALLAAARIGFSLPSDCSLVAVDATAQKVQTARQHLLALPIGNGLESDVSAEAQEEIASMKASLEDFIASSMRCAGPNPNPAEIQKGLSTKTQAFALENRAYGVNELPEEANNYGFQLMFDVRRGPDHSGLIGITSTFQIECGMDSVLVLFAPENNSWKEVVQWTSKPYKTVAGAFWSFDYQVSPPDESGHWFVVTKSIDPWCSSTWSMIRYSVLRPVPGSLTPDRIFSGSDFMWWGNDDYGSLSVESQKFDLKFHSASIDGGVHNRVWVRDFSVIGNTVHRIPPLAVSPRDFVDEWVVSPWKVAAHWSGPKALERLHTAHDLRLKPLAEFDSVRKCSDRPDHYQVAVQIGNGDQLQYFQVTGDQENYKMEAVDKLPAPACNGPDLLDSMATK